jgi:nitrite reductase/ring-hydroxylating ferredoxin subunit
MGKYVVAARDEIPAGGRKIVEVAGRSIGVFNVNGEFFAVRNRCPHQGGPLCEGRQWGFLESSGPGEYRYSRQGEVLRCPWHGWEYDIRTGQSYFDPDQVRVRSYDVSVAPGSTILETHETGDGGDASSGTKYLKGPYIAETYPVSVEKEYLLVELDA